MFIILIGRSEAMAVIESIEARLTSSKTCFVQILSIHSE